MANTHGYSKTKLYRKWCGMKGRCYSKNRKDYSRYGGRGIKVCSEWKNNFLSFMEWAINNGYKEELSIDRIDPLGDYTPNNCRFTNRYVQARNTRKLMTTNTSGYRGVSKKKNSYQARISVEDKLIHIGSYPTARMAAIAYDVYVINNNLEHTRNFKNIETKAILDEYYSNKKQEMLPSTNTTGLIGVTKVKKSGMYTSFVTHKGERYHFGSFKSKMKAALVRDTAIVALSLYTNRTKLNFNIKD